MKLSLFSLIWLLATSTLLADSSVLPKPAKYVTDKAGVLKDGGSALNEQLKKLQDDTTAQLLVYIDKKLPANTTIEDVAVKSFRSWGVGQKDRNNGIALFVFVDDRKMRLEVGYGMEGRIPDLVAKRVLDTMLKPAFKQQRYGEGINAAVAELQRLVRAESGIKTESAAGSKESQHSPFGGSASSLLSSSSSASTAPSSTSSSSNSSASSSAASSPLLEPSPAAEAAVGAAGPPLIGIKMVYWLLAGVLLTAAIVWAYLLNDLAKKEARNKQAKLDRERELARLQREEEARQRRFDAQRDSVLFQPIAQRAAPMPSRFGNSSVPLVKPKPLKAAATVAAVAGVAALSAAELARRRRLQEEEEEIARQRRRRQQDDDDSSRRSSYSSFSSSSDDSSSSSSSSSSFDSGGGSSGGGGASSDW